MKVTTRNPTIRLAAQAFQSAAEYVLVALWSTAALFTLLLGHGPHGLERRTSNIIWAVSQTDTFLLCGAILFLVFWGLHRAGASVLVLRILGALLAPTLALLIGRRSFFNVVNQSGYYFLGPLIFLAILVLMRRSLWSAAAAASVQISRRSVAAHSLRRARTLYSLRAAADSARRQPAASFPKSRGPEHSCAPLRAGHFCALDAGLRTLNRRGLRHASRRRTNSRFCSVSEAGSPRRRHKLE